MHGTREFRHEHFISVFIAEITGQYVGHNSSYVVFPVNIVVRMRF